MISEECARGWNQPLGDSGHGKIRTQQRRRPVERPAGKRPAIHLGHDRHSLDHRRSENALPSAAVAVEPGAGTGRPQFVVQPRHRVRQPVDRQLGAAAGQKEDSAPAGGQEETGETQSDEGDSP